MPAAQFNPPPNWPLPSDWTPPPGWEPDPSWPPAPPGWQFWVDDQPPSACADEEREETSPTVPHTGALAFLPGRQQSSSHSSSAASPRWCGGTTLTPAPRRPAQMLPGTYPTRPESAWYVQAQSLVPGGVPGFATPVFGQAFYASPGAIVVGEHVIIHRAPKSPEPEGARLVSLSLSDGHVEWSVPVKLADGCARGLLGNALPCIKSATTEQRAELQFIDINSGTVTSSSPIPFNLSMVATDGESLYTAGYTSIGAQEASDLAGLTVAKGSRENPVADWKTTVPEGQCEGHGGGTPWIFASATGWCGVLLVAAPTPLCGIPTARPCSTTR
jgi:hypothetical protein